MSIRPEGRLDRRDFMIGSIATAGASVALAVAAGTSNAQGAATTPADPASGTVYTGDTIQGKKVVSALDVNDLEPGKKHLLYFQGVQMPTGQHWYVSVTVAKGAKPGKRAVLTSGVHGDEMSSVHMVQTVMNQLDPGEMSGTVMAVTDVSRPAIEGMQRHTAAEPAGAAVEPVDASTFGEGAASAAAAGKVTPGAAIAVRPGADSVSRVWRKVQTGRGSLEQARAGR